MMIILYGISHCLVEYSTSNQHTHIADRSDYRPEIPILHTLYTYTIEMNHTLRNKHHDDDDDDQTAQCYFQFFFIHFHSLFTRKKCVCVCVSIEE